MAFWEKRAKSINPFLFKTSSSFWWRQRHSYSSQVAADMHLICLFPLSILHEILPFYCFRGSRHMHMSRRAHGDIFSTDSVSYQTAEDQLSMSYTFHYKKEELEMNEGVGRASIERERWRGEPLAWMMSLHHNETLLFGDHHLFCCILS